MMLHTFIKFKIFKLSLLGALSARLVLTLIAKEMRKNKKRTKPTYSLFLEEYRYYAQNSIITAILYNFRHVTIIHSVFNLFTNWTI